ncbi:hypothetical protein Tco_0373694 [Tanacetum coccineum]
MSTSTHPIIVLSYSDVEDAFSSTNTPDYTPASPDYFPASPGNTFFDPSEDLSKDLLASLAISPFHDDPYMKVMQAYSATNNESPIPLPRAPIALPTIVPPSLVLPSSPLFDPQDFLSTRGDSATSETSPESKLGHDNEIVLARVRTSTLEILIEDIQIRHRSDMKSLLDKFHELKNHKEGPPDY